MKQSYGDKPGIMVTSLGLLILLYINTSLLTYILITLLLKVRVTSSFLRINTHYH